MKTSFQIARVYGIPIRVHITLVILLPFFALQLGGAIGEGSLFWGLVGIAGLFTSVALHELGHALVSLSKGCSVREILLLPIGGIAQLERMPSRPRDEIHIALAGPLVSLALAFVAWSLAVPVSLVGWASLATVLSILGMINLMLTLFNLVPSFPMDGGRVFRAWMSTRVGKVEATRVAARIGRSLAVVFGLLGLVYGNPVWVAIAVFIFFAAGAEYRAVRTEEAMRHMQRPFFGTGWFADRSPGPERCTDDVIVGPPPHRRGARSVVQHVRPVPRGRSLFDELVDDWR